MVASLESELEAVSHNLVLRGVEVNELQQQAKYLRVRFEGFSRLPRRAPQPPALSL